jgi:hypothetical protein
MVSVASDRMAMVKIAAAGPLVRGFSFCEFRFLNVEERDQ